jgi:hypothetical protein
LKSGIKQLPGLQEFESMTVIPDTYKVIKIGLFSNTGGGWDL